LDLLGPERAFKEAIRRAVAEAFEVAPPDVPLSYPPRSDLGDLATPVAFELARTLREAPRDIAARIVAAFEPGGGISRVDVAGGGYINAFLDRRELLRRWLGQTERPEPVAADKIIVEHTNINPNKAAHIGHLRNAVLGDTLVRFLRRLGHRVEVQNYIDDTGVQVADLVVGFRSLRREGLTEVRERYDPSRLERAGERFDYIAWDLYADVTRFYEEDSSRLALRQEVLEAMERGGDEWSSLAAHVAHRMVQHHLETMQRIDVRYDLLPHESDILRLRFWERAFALLRDAQAVRFVAEGRHAGCWVMELPGVAEGAGEDQKIIVRSNGTVTYVGKDIAYQMWKFGLLDRDFEYRPFDWTPRRALYPLWSTCSEGGDPAPPRFGAASRVYNVIDVRQSYLQRVVTQALRALGHEAQADRSVHYAYEMVALTPAAVAQMFPERPLSDADRARPYLEMAGRRGLGVRADELLDLLERRALEEVRKRNPDLAEQALSATARGVAVSALRYYMLRFSRSRVVAFDLDAALAFEGETGPYLQYSVVRARNILAKLAERRGPREAERDALAEDVDLGALDAESLADHWELCSMLLRVDAVIRQAVDSLELSLVAKHAHALAQAFNSFYHKYPVAQEPREALRRARAAVVRLYLDEMSVLLELMGISIPERM
jgi:arginyl-tRNA synthetase